MSDPHIWWYVTRTSAILAWILLTFSVVWGILLATRLLRRVDDAGKLRDLHRFLGGLALVMTALHVASTMLDGWLQFSWLEALVPLQADYRPWPVALGILGLYALVAVYGSSLLKDRLPHGVWRGIHVLSYATVLAVSFHAGLAGTDAGRWWYLSLAVALIVFTGVAIVVRLLLAPRAEPAPAATATTGTAAPTATAAAPTRARGGDTVPLPVGLPTAFAPAPTVAALPTRRMAVAACRDLADGIRGLRLLSLDGDLPPWEPGSHIAIRVPGVGPRQYSLCGDPTERRAFEIAVLRDPGSRGGSTWMHAVEPGDILEVEEPRNHFRLVPSTATLFIAGGIGITPLLAMIESLPAKRVWRLWYLGRSRSTMAFLPELLREYPDRVDVYARDEHPERARVTPVVADWPGDVIACGPRELTEEILAAGRPGRVHVENFAPIEHEALPASGIRVRAERSGRDVDVAPDQPVLAALEAAGVPVLGSCRRGVCGGCEVRVLDGRPEHLDSVLPAAEADELGVMYPCVSRALDDRLVLDV